MNYKKILKVVVAVAFAVVVCIGCDDDGNGGNCGNSADEGAPDSTCTE